MGRIEVTRLTPFNRRTIREAFSEISQAYSTLAETLGELIPEIPEDFCLEDKYTQTQESALAIADYYRTRAGRIPEEDKTPLYKREGTPGYKTLKTLEDILLEIPGEIERDFTPRELEEGELLLWGTATKTIVEIAKVVKTANFETGYLLFPETPSLEDTEDYIIQTKSSILYIYLLAQSLDSQIREDKDSLSPKLRQKYTEVQDTTNLVLLKLGEVLNNFRTDQSLEEIKSGYSGISDLTEALERLAKEKETDYKRETFKGKRVYMEYKSQEPERSSALEELQKISSLPKSGQITIPKDFAESQIHTAGDLAEIGTEEDKRVIEKLQRQGQLLWTLEGLSGGTAYFKSFSLVLAKLLNEQSKYYNTEETGSGVPTDLVKQIFGESAKVEKTKDPVPLNGANRPFPYILVSYERIAKEMSETGKISGGKDIDYIRTYINGGYREFEVDPKTGNKRPVKTSYVPGLTSKKYPLSDGKGHFIWLPFIVNEMEITDATRKDPDIGCLLRLNPLYSVGLRKYTSFRSDTIQLIGGGRQKDITMDLLDKLVYSRGVGEELRVPKDKLLEKYRKKSSYLNERGYVRQSKLEADFQTAIRKAIDAKILLPGTTKTGGLKGYREEKTPGGMIISVFTFNPDYLKGEVISPEVQ